MNFMKMSLMVVAQIALTLACISESSAQVRQDAGTKLLVPSSAGTGSFTSLLVVLNLDSQPNNVTITARQTDGTPIGAPISTTLPVGGRFRSANIFGDMGVPASPSVFGPITVESTNGKLLSAVSEVSSAEGNAGFFPGVNVATAWTEGFILEVADTGDEGQIGTHRTNLGLNTVAAGSTNVSVTFYNSSGTQLGSTAVTVPGNGLTQINGIVRQALGATTVTGQNGYLRIISDQPVIAWASKIENGFNDPSFQIGVAAAPASQSAFSVRARADIDRTEQSADQSE
jgi:hypothetical protein